LATLALAGAFLATLTFLGEAFLAATFYEEGVNNLWKLIFHTLTGEAFFATTFFTGAAFLGEAFLMLALATIWIDDNVLDKIKLWGNKVWKSAHVQTERRGAKKIAN
jgi:hypothetical protein